MADVFDALTAWRPYKKPWSIDQAIDYLQNERGRKFDPNCVDAFLANRGQAAEIVQSLADVPPTTAPPANQDPDVSPDLIHEHVRHG